MIIGSLGQTGVWAIFSRSLRDEHIRTAHSFPSACATRKGLRISDVVNVFVRITSPKLHCDVLRSSTLLLNSAFKNGSAEVGTRLLRVVARAVASSRVVPIAEGLAVVAYSIARERSAFAHELCALGVRRVFLCPAHFTSIPFVCHSGYSLTVDMYHASPVFTFALLSPNFLKKNGIIGVHLRVWLSKL